MFTHQITADANLEYLVKMVSARFLTFQNDHFSLCFISIFGKDTAILCQTSPDQVWHSLIFLLILTTTVMIGKWLLSSFIYFTYAD